MSGHRDGAVAVQLPGRRIGPRELRPLLAGWQTPTGPAYRLLADRVRTLILDGRLPVHAVLPSERALAEITGTSRTTTTAAYRRLRDDGFLDAGQGAGTWTALPDSADPGAAEGHGTDRGLPFPVVTSGERGTPDGRGDLSSAAPEAPAQVHAAYVAALSELPRHLPGHGYVAAGLPALRDRIAQRYTERGLATTPEQVLVTSGAQHGLRLVLSTLLAPGAHVLCERPTYPLAVDAIRRAGGRPVGLDVEDGWDDGAADALIRSSRARLAYLMPDFHNPTGRLLDEPGRERLARVLRRRGCVPVVDETTVDLDLRPGAGHRCGRGVGALPRPAPLAASCPDAICLGSASKTFWGGLRVGWVRADEALVRRLTLLRAADDLGSPLLEQLATAHLLDDLTEVLRERLAVLRARREALTMALSAALPGWEVPTPDGGLVLWCRLPEPRSTSLTAAARGLGVVITPGPRFAVDGVGFDDRLRVPFARPAAELTAAAALLGRAWHGEPAGFVDPDETLVV